jgi:F-type H+-transporting ATPase subunit O
MALYTNFQVLRTSYFIMARNISTSSSRNALIQAPLQLFGLEGRYAHALYSAASREKKLEAVDKELQRFQETLKGDRRLTEMLLDPTVRRQAKLPELKKLATRLQLTPVSSNFLMLVAGNGRLKRLPGMLGSFGKLMAAQRGQVLATVTSARPLDESTLSEVRSALHKMVAAGRSLQIATRVDPAILGGLVVAIGDRHIDISVAARVRALTETIRTVSA